VCVDLVKGFIGVHWRGFRGDDPGWPRFDQCSASLTRLIRSLALMTVIKNGGRHNSLGLGPPSRSSSSRRHSIFLHVEATDERPWWRSGGLGDWRWEIGHGVVADGQWGRGGGHDHECDTPGF
jgi:hypothetical protein